MEGSGMDLFSPYIEKPFVRAQKEGCFPRDEDVSIGGTWSTITEDGDAYPAEPHIY
jgi:hypothetical protein